MGRQSFLQGKPEGGDSLAHPGVVFTHLALVELVHSLCDPIAIIHPHHPGKPRDKACVTWGGRRSGSPAGPHLPPGVSGQCVWAPTPSGRGVGLQSAHPWEGPKGSLLTCSPPWALGGEGTHLRWLCAGSGWGGPAGAACGTCPHRVSPASGRVVGTSPSCSGTAEGGGCGSLPSPCPGLAGVGPGPVFPGCPSVTWYCPGASQAGVVLFQASSPSANRNPGCPRSLEPPFLPGGQGA